MVIPSIGTLNDTMGVILPLSVIVGFSVLKEGYMDVKRWLADRKANSRKYRKLISD